MNFTVKINREVSVLDFQSVRKTANFINYSDEDTAHALEHSLFVVGIYNEFNNPIGVARVIGDGKIAFIIKDVIVVPKYQKNRVGHRLMLEIFKYLDVHAVEKAYVGLMSTKNNEAFYEHYGFIRRPNEDYGSGMILYYEKKH